MQIELAKTVIFIPSIFEAKKIFDDINFINYKNFTLSNYKGRSLVISGVSKTITAYTLTRFLSNYTPADIMLIGVAGAYKSSRLNIGDIVSVTNDYLLDEATLSGNKLTTLQEKGFMAEDDIVGKFSSYANLPEVSSNTVSLLYENNSMADIYSQKYGASTENMEGASFGIVANKFNIRAYQIRAISNLCGDKDTQNWNIKLATANLKNFVSEALS